MKSKLGVLSFKHKSRSGHFMYNFRISDYHAAKILEYIDSIPHETEPFRDKLGRYVKVEDLLANTKPRRAKASSREAIGKEDG